MLYEVFLRFDEKTGAFRGAHQVSIEDNVAQAPVSLDVAQLAGVIDQVAIEALNACTALLEERQKLLDRIEALEARELGTAAGAE